MPLHIHATPADLAPIALLPGDPGRAERIAARLDGAVCYNRNRALLGFTGGYHGVRLSVQTTGMGAPATAIVAEELIQLGVQTLIRVGTAGALVPTVRPGDLIIATASTPLDGATAAYLQGQRYAPVASFAVVQALAAAVAASKMPSHTGLIVTDDVFYHPDAGRLAFLAGFGVLAVEMEASVLFTIAARHGRRAGCLLSVSNVLGDTTWPDPALRERSVDAMIDVALEAAAYLATNS